MRLIGGGRGCLIIVTRRGERSGWSLEWISTEASEAMARAASRLGMAHGETWLSVVHAIGAGCLDDVLSEAIEEQESMQ